MRGFSIGLVEKVNDNPSEKMDEDKNAADGGISRMLSVRRKSTQAHNRWTAAVTAIVKQNGNQIGTGTETPELTASLADLRKRVISEQETDQRLIANVNCKKLNEKLKKIASEQAREEELGKEVVDEKKSDSLRRRKVPEKEELGSKMKLKSEISTDKQAVSSQGEKIKDLTEQSSAIEKLTKEEKEEVKNNANQKSKVLEALEEENEPLKCKDEQHLLRSQDESQEIATVVPSNKGNAVLQEKAEDDIQSDKMADISEEGIKDVASEDSEQVEAVAETKPMQAETSSESTSDSLWSKKPGKWI